MRTPDDAAADIRDAHEHLARQTATNLLTEARTTGTVNPATAAATLATNRRPAGGTR